MTAAALWTRATGLLRDYLEVEVHALRDELAPHLVATNPTLDGRLLDAVEPPPGNPLGDLVREIVAALNVDSPIRVHGWRRDPSPDPHPDPSRLGLAVALTDPTNPRRFAVVALTPGPVPTPGQAVIDAVVSTGSGPLTFSSSLQQWKCDVAVTCPQTWTASLGPGGNVSPPQVPTATIHAERTTPVQLGMTGGPGLGLDAFALTLSASPGSPTVLHLDLKGVRATLLPADLANLIGVAPAQTAGGSDGGPVTVTIAADHVNGIQFADGGARLGIPLNLKAQGLTSHGTQMSLTLDGNDLHVALTTSLTATLPGLPLNATIDDAGFSLPFLFPAGGRPGLGSVPATIVPDGIGVELALPPVSGAGRIIHRDGQYSGLIAADLGVIAVQAVAQLRPPGPNTPTSFLVMLGVVFPPPGIQLSFGFALDAVGGLVGINHRVGVTALRRLVSDGNSDRVLFPDDVVGHADDVIGALTDCFPSALGRFVIAPMVRLTWGEDRMVSLAGALVLDLPAPVQASILGRLEVNVPDPLVPLIHLQASVLGTFDPGVPSFEILVSLAGSWMVGLAIRGELYLLVRGGDHPEFVVSAGGFHPRYERPVGVPALQRLHMDLRPGLGFGMAIDAYFALTANSVQFGGQLHLEAMLAKCGVEGWLGLDALFRYEPTFAFTVAIRAGVAVRAFGHRLAGIGLSFTLEGPAPWHAHGKGSISVLFWDVSLDFDIRWGTTPAVAAKVIGPDQIAADVRAALARPKAWVAQRPANETTGLRFTPAAEHDMAAGMLVHPDAIVRIDQSVLPLGVQFSRYGRAHVPAQTWTIGAVTVWGASAPPAAAGPPLQQFVRAAFNDLSEDEQLTAPATLTAVSGTSVSVREAAIDSAHQVDDGYETGYLHDRQLRDHRPRWIGIFLEEAGLGWNGRARLARWRAGPDTRIDVLDPRLAQVTTTAPLGPHLHALSVQDGTGAAITITTTPDLDPWQTLQDATVTGAATQLFESWEIPR